MDVLTGNGSDNLLDGGANGDEINGGGGNDTIIGGAGDDVLTGGTGADMFKFGADFGADVILDFTVGEDKLAFATGSVTAANFSLVGGDLTFTSGASSITFVTDATGFVFANYVVLTETGTGAARPPGRRRGPGSDARPFVVSGLARDQRRRHRLTRERLAEHAERLASG